MDFHAKLKFEFFDLYRLSKDYMIGVENPPALNFKRHIKLPTGTELFCTDHLRKL